MSVQARISRNVKPAASHHSFVRHNLHGNIFSAEKGNLYAKHSYKHSGACTAAVGQQLLEWYLLVRRSQQR